MRYVDAFVLPVPTKNLKKYKKMAVKGGKLWKKHGALQYMECVGDDLTTAATWGALPFPRMVKPKKGESIMYSFIVYKSKKHRDAVNKKVMSDPAMAPGKNEKMPFDMRRMAYGGFEALVDA